MAAGIVSNTVQAKLLAIFQVGLQRTVSQRTGDIDLYLQLVMCSHMSVEGMGIAAAQSLVCGHHTIKA